MDGAERYAAARRSRPSSRPRECGERVASAPHTRPGRVLKRQTLTTDYGGAPTFSAAVKSAGWYTLSVTSTRKLAARLSTSVSLSWHFHADPRVSQVAPGYLAKLTPSGLNAGNSVAERSTTPVSIWLSRTMTPGPTVR